MLKFRTRRSFTGKANYLGHDFQRRLVWIAMGIIVGAILINQSTGRIPSFDRLFNRSEPEIDNRVAPKRVLTDPDAVARADGQVPDEPAAPAGGPLKPGDGPPETEGGTSKPAEGPLKPVSTKKLFGGADTEWFLGLEDDAVYRNDENAAFFSLLKILATADENDLRVASVGHRTFRQLYEQPDDYRGEIVTVEGNVERIIPQTNPPPNEQGIKKYYEVWIKPSGNNVPIVAVCTELPPDYPAGGVKTFTTITGFFYKRLGYASRQAESPESRLGVGGHVFRSSPLVLAKTLSWRRAEAPATEEDEAGPPLPFGIPRKYGFAVLGVGVLAMVMLAFWSYRLSRTSVLTQGPIVGRKRREAEAESEPKDLNNLRF